MRKQRGPLGLHRDLPVSWEACSEACRAEAVSAQRVSLAASFSHHGLFFLFRLWPIGTRNNLDVGEKFAVPIAAVLSPTEREPLAGVISEAAPSDGWG